MFSETNKARPHTAKAKEAVEASSVIQIATEKPENSPTTVQNDCSTNVVVVEESVQKPVDEVDESGPEPVDEVDESGPSGGGQAKKKKPSSTKKNDSRKASLAQASKTKNKGDLSDIRAAQRTLRRQAKRKME